MAAQMALTPPQEAPSLNHAPTPFYPSRAETPHPSTLARLSVITYTYQSLMLLVLIPKHRASKVFLDQR